MWTWVIGSRIGRIALAVAGVVSAVGAAFLSGMARGSRKTRDRAERDDLRTALDKRKQSEQLRKKHDAELSDLSDTDLDDRLREIRRRGNP